VVKFSAWRNWSSRANRSPARTTVEAMTRVHQCIVLLRVHKAWCAVVASSRSQRVLRGRLYEVEHQYTLALAHLRAESQLLRTRVVRTATASANARSIICLAVPFSAWFRQTLSNRDAYLKQTDVVKQHVNLQILAFYVWQRELTLKNKKELKVLEAKVRDASNRQRKFVKATIYQEALCWQCAVIARWRQAVLEEHCNRFRHQDMRASRQVPQFGTGNGPSLQKLLQAADTNTTSARPPKPIQPYSSNAQTNTTVTCPVVV